MHPRAAEGLATLPVWFMDCNVTTMKEEDAESRVQEDWRL